MKYYLINDFMEVKESSEKELKKYSFKDLLWSNSTWVYHNKDYTVLIHPYQNIFVREDSQQVFIDYVEQKVKEYEEKRGNKED